jgi:hypothetical protein
MTDSVDEQAALARWVGDVKVLLDNLNELLERVPEGLDVKVAAGETYRNKTQGGVTNFAEAASVWQITISATKTQKYL